MSTYTLQQQVFTLSMMSGQESGVKGTAADLESKLAKKIDFRLKHKSLADLIGNWTRVWGPVVWQDTGATTPSTVADNAMYVAYNAAENVYVVAVAGTDFASAYDWETEDLSVKTLVSWSGPGMISQGTLDGLNVLLGMTNEQNQTISAYLQTIGEWSTAQLIFTGHSLGGALAPVLALSLFPDLVTPRWIDGVWSTGWPLSHIFVYPTAGPTPGNQEFANFFDATFPAGAQGFNQLVWNSLDLVPHAWAPSTFNAKTLEDLYGSDLPASDCIKNVITLAMGDLPTQDPYVQLSNQQFAGTYATPAKNYPDATCTYIAQVLYQHIYAYYLQLAPELLDLKYDVVLNLFAPINPTSEKGVNEVTTLYNNVIKPQLEKKKICKST